MPKIIRLPRLVDRSNTTKKETITASRKLKSMTVKDLKKYISQGIKSINKALTEEKKTKGDFGSDFRRGVKKLGEGFEKKGGGVKVGTENLKKKDLIKRAALVEATLKADTESEEAARRKSEKVKQAFKTYKERHGGSDLTQDQYIELTYIYGDLKNLLFEYGYEDEEIKEAIMQALEDGVKKGLTRREIERMLIAERSFVKSLPTSLGRAAYIINIIREEAERKSLYGSTSYGTV